MKRFLLFALMLIVLSGCSSEPGEVGIVARVNGHPIQLSQLEFQHDLMQADYGGRIVPGVEKLRTEYGQILGDLIVQELILQELQRLDLAVTDKELKEAEDQVRSDYPEGAFEQVLIEEYIDLKAWRQQLLYHLAVKKFYSQVLRPKAKIDYKEAEAYYKQHIADYFLPDSLKLLVLRGPNRQLVERAVERYLTDNDLQSLTRSLGEVSAREVIVREGKLPVSWKSVLDGVQPGQASGVLSEKFGFEAIVLLERSPAKVLTPTQAYPLVEEALLDQKLATAFSEWLDGALSRSVIEVSEHLVPKSEEEGQGEEDSEPSS